MSGSGGMVGDKVLTALLGWTRSAFYECENVKMGEKMGTLFNCLIKWTYFLDHRYMQSIPEAKPSISSFY